MVSEPCRRRAPLIESEPCPRAPLEERAGERKKSESCAERAPEIKSEPFH